MDSYFNNVYSGAIHIHTNLSDGSGNIKSVAKAAKKAGLKWIIITDHNYYDTNEGIIDGVYVIKAQEISPKQNNHYLAFGLNDIIEPNNNPQVYTELVRQKGGFGFAAHPDEGTVLNEDGKRKNRRNSYHCIPWTNKNIEPDGIEIWNWFSNWADNLDDSNLFKLAYAYLFKHNIIKPPSEITLKWWDELNTKKDYIVPAIGGVDAHALKIYKYIIPVTVFPYETCFKTITNIIYLDEELSTDFQYAKKQIFNAIKHGNNIILNRHICKSIPQIYITNSKGIYFPGQNVELDEKCCLHFKANKVMEICLIYNGNERQKFITDKFVFPITKSGKYRLEVFLRGQSFLYTNPYCIKV